MSATSVRYELSSAHPASRRAIKNSVLLVDDDSSVLRAERRALMCKCRVDSCLNAESAAAKLAGGEYDAIVTDFDMPLYNGIWLLTQAAARYPRMKRILVSGNQPELFAPHLRSGLIQYYCPKPLSTERLFALLQETVPMP